MARLGDICEIVSGTTPKTNIPEYWGGEINWITPAEIDENTQIIFESERKITNKAVQSGGLSPFPAGTVVLSSRAPIGKVAIAGVEMYCNQGFKNLICSEAIYNKYLYWFLKSKTDYLNSLGRGATFKEISKEIVSNIDVPLRSLEEQHYIADLLDKISSLISLRKQQLAKLDELVKARFVEMFGDMPKRNFVSLESICSIITDGTHQPPKFVSAGIPFLFVSNLITNQIIYDTEKFISEETYNELIKRTPIENGDILITTVGSYGHPAVVESDKKFCFQRHIAYLKPICDFVNSYYLYGALLSSNVQNQIKAKVKGIAQKTLNLSEIRTLKLPLPLMEQQELFSVFLQKTVETRLTFQQELDKLEMLKKALMQEYFGGGESL